MRVRPRTPSACRALPLPGYVGWYCAGVWLTTRPGLSSSAVCQLTGSLSGGLCRPGHGASGGGQRNARHQHP